MASGLNLWFGGPEGNSSLENMEGGQNSDYINHPDRVMADVLRDEYNRNIDMYRPLEDYLFENLNRWGDITQSEQQAAYGRSQEMFRLGKGSYERDLRGMGVSLNPDERKSLTRQYDMAAAKSAIDAANQTGRQYDDLKLGLVGGIGGPNAGSN